MHAVLGCQAWKGTLLQQHAWQCSVRPSPVLCYAVLCCVVKQAVEPAFGGSSSASLDAVVAKLTRAKAGKGYHTAREALLLNGRFVLAQVRLNSVGSGEQLYCTFGNFAERFHLHALRTAALHVPTCCCLCLC